MNTSWIQERAKRLRVALATLTLFAVAAIGSAQPQRPNVGPQMTDSIGGLTISPLIYRVETVAGHTGVLTFDITGAIRAQVNIKAKMWSATFDEGSYASQLNVKHARDASGWFGSKTEIQKVVKPRDRTTLAIPYKVPTSANGVYWALLTFEPKPVGSNEGVTLRYEVPIIFSVGKPGKPELKVQTPEVYANEKTTMVVVKIRNITRNLAVVGATAEIRAALTGTLVQKVSVNDRNLLPFTTRDIQLVIDKKLKDGAYKVYAHAEIGVRRMPNVMGEFLVQGGKVKMVTAATMHELTPVLVEPGGFDMTVAPGGKTFKSLSFVNTGDKPITIQIAARNVEQTDTGAIGVGEGNVPQSMQVSISPTEIELAPRTRASARMIVETAAGSEGDQWFGIEVIEKGNPKAFSQQLLAVVTFKNTQRPKMDVTEIETRKDPRGSALQVLFDVANTGNSNVAAAITCDLFRKGDTTKMAVIEPKVPANGQLIPGIKVRGSAMLPATLEPGSYDFVLKVQYSEKDVIEKHVPITIVGATNPQKR